MKLHIKVIGSRAQLTRQEGALTTGMVGASVEFTFDEIWDGLHRVAVFRAGEVEASITCPNNTVDIPAAVLTEAGNILEVAVYGYDNSGSLVIPTVYVRACTIHEGAKPNVGTPDAPSSYADLQAQIGDLDALHTQSKDNLVQAINEVAEQVSGLENGEEGGSGGASYVLPVASPDILGGVKPVAKTGEMTQAVGVDEKGMLFTAPGESGDCNCNQLELICSLVLEEEVSSIVVSADNEGNPFDLKMAVISLQACGGTANTTKSNIQIWPNTVNAAAIRHTITNGLYAAGNGVNSATRLTALGDSYFEWQAGISADTFLRHSIARYPQPDNNTISKLNFKAVTDGFTFGVGTILNIWGVRV